VSEGKKGLLVKCWSGCSLADICQAVGIQTKDLFFDSLETDLQQRRATAKRRAKEKGASKLIELVNGYTIDALREADYFIHSRSNIDISLWSLEGLDKELNALADAYKLVEQERATL
jgi:hypothetical protein